MLATVTVTHPKRGTTMTWYFDVLSELQNAVAFCLETKVPAFVSQTGFLPRDEIITDSYELKAWLIEET